MKDRFNTYSYKSFWITHCFDIDLLIKHISWSQCIYRNWSYSWFHLSTVKWVSLFMKRHYNNPTYYISLGIDAWMTLLHMLMINFLNHIILIRIPEGKCTHNLMKWFFHFFIEAPIYVLRTIVSVWCRFFSYVSHSTPSFTRLNV